VSQTAVSRTSRLKAQRASENGAYVRKLLRQRQPEFAATLAAAESMFRSVDTGLIITGIALVPCRSLPIFRGGRARPS
jgi:hypothetical protein